MIKTENGQAWLKWLVEGPSFFHHFPFLTRRSIVWEVGAYEGEWASEIAKKYGCRVHAFEPILKSYEVCRHTCYELPVTVHHFGLGAWTRGLLFGNNHDSSGLFSDMDWKESVDIREIGEVMGELGFPGVDLIHINIEGGEYELLPHLHQQNLTRHFYSFLVQFHEFPDRGREEERGIIRRQLSETHDMVFQYDLIYELWVRR